MIPTVSAAWIATNSRAPMTFSVKTQSRVIGFDRVISTAPPARKPGRMLAVLTRAGLVMVWDLERRATVAQFEISPATVGTQALMDVDATGRWLAYADTKSTVRVLELHTGAVGRVLTGHEAPVHDVRFVDGTLTSVDAAGIVKTWQPVPRIEFDHVEHSIFRLVFSPTGDRLYGTR